MESILPEQILKQYRSFKSHSRYPIKIHNDTLRQQDSDNQLQRVFFAFSIFFASRCCSLSGPFIIMVTASHNPPQYNGLKCGALRESLPFSQEEIEDVINNQQAFEKLIQKINVQPSFKPIDCIIGRDTRPTSEGLTQIIKSGFHLLGRKVLDLGQGSTPQIFSMGEYIYDRMIKEQIQFSPSLSLAYFNEIEASFAGGIRLIQINTNRKWKKKRICLDFANGVGAISFSHYAFLNKYFEFVVVNNKQFDQPNVNCGAEWIYKNKFNLTALNTYPQVDESFIFDGDCDRIVAKFHEQPFLIDGDDFNACFSLLLKDLLKKSGVEQHLRGSVANIVSNAGLDQFLSSIGLHLERVPVGVKNLFNAAKNHDVCCYFESNGHGCIYFDSNLVDDLTRQSSSSWHAQILLLIHKLSRNNTRGYALHNMLILQLYLYYFEGAATKLFEKQNVLELRYDLKNPHLFSNSQEGKRLLIQPKCIVAELSQIQKEFIDCDMTVRKSDTTPLLRITVQGPVSSCDKIKIKIDKFLRISLSEQ